MASLFEDACRASGRTISEKRTASQSGPTKRSKPTVSTPKPKPKPVSCAAAERAASYAQLRSHRALLGTLPAPEVTSPAHPYPRNTYIAHSTEWLRLHGGAHEYAEEDPAELDQGARDFLRTNGILAVHSSRIEDVEAAYSAVITAKGLQRHCAQLSGSEHDGHESPDHCTKAMALKLSQLGAAPPTGRQHPRHSPGFTAFLNSKEHGMRDEQQGRRQSGRWAMAE